jgi:iron complex outermembrane receptor protein
MKISNLSFSIALLFLATSYGMASESYFLLRGQVIDAQTGVPIPSANVKLAGERSSTTTNLDGIFTIDGLHGTIHTIEITHISYYPLEYEIYLPSPLMKFELQPRSITMQEVIATTGRGERGKTPGALTNIDSRSVERANAVTEPPFLAMKIPNATFFNWDGATLGPTHLRIRGFDSNRLAISVNGVPINDPEDYNVYWQDTPDFLSNTHDIQVESGVSSFAAAPAGIGGGVNLVTSDAVAKRQAELGLHWGTFNTTRRTALYRSGLVDEKYNFTGRVSHSASDGYRDHSAVEEWAYFFAATRYGPHSITTLNVYGGQEVSDLSYTAVEMSVLDTNRTWTPEANRDVGWDGERDDFKQPHNILRSEWRITPDLKLEQALFWIQGTGYYEQFKHDRDMTEYGLSPYIRHDSTGAAETVDETDLIRRKHVDKDQIGWMPKIHWRFDELTDMNFGLELRHYYSDHFGRVMWAREFLGSSVPQARYYSWNMTKDYAGVSGQIQRRLNDRLRVFAGLEVRTISQEIDQQAMGIYNGYKFGNDWSFINPRVGASFAVNSATDIYASLAMAGREPTIDQLLNGDNPFDQPKLSRYGYKEIEPERMTDFEFGARRRVGNFDTGVNFYLLFFNDEIVNTGRYDPVLGELERTNAPTSRHLGLELDASWKAPVEGLRLTGDLSLDNSTLGEFTYHYVDSIDRNWNYVDETINASGNQIPMTPQYVFNLRANYMRAYFDAELGLHSVSRQFLDPRGDDLWSLEPYSLLNATVGYRLSVGGWNCRASLNILNLLDNEYESFGWTETIDPPTDSNGDYILPATNRYVPKFIPAAGRMIKGGLTFEM